MKNIFSFLALIGALFMIPTASATPATDSLLATYKAAGATGFSAQQGQKSWTKESKHESGKMMSCTACHGDDLSKEGKHYKTGKTIKPMAPSVNAERLTDAKKIEKWFRRNCNDVWSRKCTAQEKGDILMFLLSK